MMLRPLFIAAAGLSAASAFLLPPEIRNGLPQGLSIFTEGTRTLFLDCPGCPVPVAQDEGKIRLATGIQSHLELAFRIDNTGKQPRLMVNDFELFPHPDPAHNALVAKHVPESKEDGSAPAPVEAAVPVRLGASLGWHRKPTSNKTPMSLITVNLQILELISGFQEGIPNVEIDLVHCGHSGRLRIAHIRQTESQSRKHLPLAQKLAECGDSFFCKVNAIMMDKAAKVSGKLGMGKGCKTHHAHQMGGMGGHHNGHNHHGHMKPGSAVMSHPHHKKPSFKLREHSWGQLFNKFAHHILFPVGVGIVAGVTVSIIGMAIGTLLVGMWRVFVRGQTFFPRRRSRSNSRSKKGAAPAMPEEKAALMADIEEPPVYQDEEPKENN